ncbi:hypothetical protein RGU12_10470 [Fredinandcohnia sp. QZ13]|uniref:hypothetical protein n=1 Tax=Fredinandcohnia sp. QZ13 TaxID=3073144 RepID=UPI0028536A01|nr:hypothetical protein [Fredinandcohnia sp. QZ13]MDR4887972.1 hypothetical protein [Fredinandcohnia sp. QZ13]
MNNRQAIGYMLLACKQLNYSKEQTRSLFGEMYNMFDLKTEEEAEEQGYEWYYSLEDTFDVVKKPVVTKTRAKKITKFPDNYKSQISKENEKLIKLLNLYKQGN